MILYRLYDSLQHMTLYHHLIPFFGERKWILRSLRDFWVPGIQGRSGHWCLVHIRASSHKCLLYSPRFRFPLYKKGYWKISTILSNSDILWFCGLGHVHLLSNTISLAPEFKVILLCCETQRDIRRKSDMITFRGWSHRVRRKLVWSQRKAAWNLVSCIY